MTSMKYSRASRVVFKNMVVVMCYGHSGGDDDNNNNIRDKKSVQGLLLL